MALEPVPHLGQPHAMQWALLGAVALLLAPGDTSMEKEGEMCRHGMQPATEPLQCPARLDSVDAAFCCGTCSSPRCCSSREDRLDQEKCLMEGQRKEDGSPVQASTNTEPWAGESPYRMQFLPYLYAVVATIFLSVIGCWCCCRCQSEEIQMYPICPPEGSCITGPPPPHGLDPTPCGTEDPCAPVASPSVLDDTGAVQLGGANHEDHNGEDLNVFPGSPVDTNGCGPSLVSSMNGEKSKESARDEGDLEWPQDDSEQSGPCVDGSGTEQLWGYLEQSEPSVDGEVEKQPKPAAGSGDLELPEAGLDGEDEDMYLNMRF